MSRLYVTGSTGFIGANLLPYLGTRGFADVTRIGRRVGDVSFDDLAGATVAPGSSVIHLAGKAHDVAGTSADAEYEAVNVGLTQRIYDRFLASDATTFIYVSSVKALADHTDRPLVEEMEPRPGTSYGRSKITAERYISANPAGAHQSVFVLRPAMTHGPGVKGNLGLLYRLISLRLPYPLGAFDNRRSLLSVENLCFTMHAALTGALPPGDYNVADDEALSTSQILDVMAVAVGRSAHVLRPPRKLMTGAARVGDVLHLPLTSDRLARLTESYEVSTAKLVRSLGGRPLPVDARSGLTATAMTLSRPGRVRGDTKRTTA